MSSNGCSDADWRKARRARLGNTALDLECPPCRSWYAHEVAKEWTDFFTVLTSVAGAVLALLFVALQVGADKWRTVPLRRTAAARNLIELASPLAVGLFAIYPGGRWWLGGIIAATVGLAGVIAYAVRYRRASKPQPRYERAQYRLGTPLLPILYGTLLIFSILNTDLGLKVVGWAAIWALMSGITQTFFLLVSDTPPPNTSVGGQS